MATTPVYGYQARLAVDTAGTATTSAGTGRLDFISSTLGVDEEFVDTSGLRGTRARAIERLRAGIRRCDGQIKCNPSAIELAILLPWALGGTVSGTSYPLGEVMPSRNVFVDKVQKNHLFSLCYVDKFTIHGVQGMPLEMTVDVIGTDETVSAAGTGGTFPALALDVANAPFMFQDLAMAVNSVTYFVKDFTLTVDNVLDKDRFYNSQTRTAVIATDRHVSLNLQLPYGDASAAYGAGAGGLAAVATFTNGGASLTHTFVKAVFPRKPIEVARPEIIVPFQGLAMKSGSTLEVTTALVLGP